MHYAPANGRGNVIDEDSADPEDVDQIEDGQDTRDRVIRRRTPWEERYVLDTAGSARTWMSPELQLEEAELDHFYRSVLDSLEPRARLAFLMVRELGLSYDGVATQLGIATPVVHEHVTNVERRFREELKHVDMEALVISETTARSTAPAAERRPQLRLIRGGLTREAVRPMSDRRGAA